MTLTATGYKHIVLDERNIPVIAETSMKVIELITSVKAYGWSPEQLHDNYPYLSMSKIYSALAYYWERKEEIDQAIEQEAQWAAAARLLAGESPFVARLSTQGLLE